MLQAAELVALPPPRMPVAGPMVAAGSVPSTNKIVADGLRRLPEGRRAPGRGRTAHAGGCGAPQRTGPLVGRLATQWVAEAPDHTGAAKASRRRAKACRSAIAVLDIDEGNLEKGEELMQSLEEDLFQGDPRRPPRTRTRRSGGALAALQPRSCSGRTTSRPAWGGRRAPRWNSATWTVVFVSCARPRAWPPQGNNGGVLLARHYLAQGDRKAAYELARRHLKERGFTSPKCTLIMARSATAIGRYGVAMADLEKLAAIPGQEPLAYAEMADVERAKDGLDAALASVESRTLDLSDRPTRCCSSSDSTCAVPCRPHAGCGRAGRPVLATEARKTPACTRSSARPCCAPGTPEAPSPNSTAPSRSTRRTRWRWPGAPRSPGPPETPPEPLPSSTGPQRPTPSSPPTATAPPRRAWPRETSRGPAGS